MGKSLYAQVLLTIFALAGPAPLSLAQGPTSTLYEQAKQAGGTLVWRYKPNRTVIYPNIEELAKRSDLIVVGRAVGHKSRLRGDGKFITNDFWVRVQDVIKGDLREGHSIIVSLPGGAYRFEDHTIVLVKPTNYQEAEDGKTYVFFLKKKGSVYKGHEPASESQGLFELTGGTVRPADLVAEDPIVRKYTEMSAAAFLTEIHRAVPRTKM